MITNKIRTYLNRYIKFLFYIFVCMIEFACLFIVLFLSQWYIKIYYQKKRCQLVIFFFLYFMHVHGQCILCLFFFSCVDLKREGGILFYLCPSFCPSKLFFVAFFSVTVDDRNLIFGHKLHIGTPYRGKRFQTHQIPTSCLSTLLIFKHIEHICSFFVAFFSATIDGRNLIFGHKLYIGTPYRGKHFWTHQIPTSCLAILLIFIHI